MTRQEAAKIAGEDPDYHTRDLFNAIESGNYPTWTVYVQVMSPEEAENYRWNIFDITKVWPHSDYPLRPIGKMTLNKNVSCACVSRLEDRRLLMPSSQQTISNRLSRPRSHRLRWFRGLLHLLIHVRNVPLSL